MRGKQCGATTTAAEMKRKSKGGSGVHLYHFSHLGQCGTMEALPSHRSPNMDRKVGRTNLWYPHCSLCPPKDRGRVAALPIPASSPGGGENTGMMDGI